MFIYVLDEVMLVAQAGLRLKFPLSSAFYIAGITDKYMISSLAYLFFVGKVTFDYLNIFCCEIVHLI